MTVAEEMTLVADGRHADPHRVLGAHADGGRMLVRAWLPGAAACRVRVTAHGPERIVDAAPGPVLGSFVADLGAWGAGGESRLSPPVYDLLVHWQDGQESEVEDPYRFWPTVGELDLHLWGEGRHQEPWRRLGARVVEHQDVLGTAFAVWAPNARSVSVVGDWNFWDHRSHPMRTLGGSGVWELFVPAAVAGNRYAFDVVTAQGQRVRKADPFASEAEPAPGTASRVFRTAYAWNDGEWLARRPVFEPRAARVSIYECHLGSWRRAAGDRVLSYRELADTLPAYVAGLGFTHLEFLPVAEHPFGGSWGYQVTSYFAPTSRYGSPDDFRALVDACHAHGLGVIVDWVPAHFPRDGWALARFDGTALYEHADPRQGEHPDWGTLVFNFGRNEVRNFLVASALAWFEEFHVDGLRVDAVASMLYLDYSRQPGEWVPNPLGGRENLAAVDLLREVNELTSSHHPGAMVIAEESTAWPGVTRSGSLGGLGFTFKWNMGWMHDTLEYFNREPIHRRHHQHELTFGLLYAFSEYFVLPLSHDEVVHGKGSLLNKMPGDRWQQMANLRSLFAWMWAHPGKPLVFMGGEFAQEREWSHDRSLDWHLLERAHDSGASQTGFHAGMQRLVRRLNSLAAEYPVLWDSDGDPDGFHWIDADDSDQNVLSFLRRSTANFAPTRSLACVANLSPVVRHDYRVGVPTPGRWEEVLSTDAHDFGGSGISNPDVVAETKPWHGLPCSVSLILPPLGVAWLVAPPS